MDEDLICSCSKPRGTSRNSCRECYIYHLGYLAGPVKSAEIRKKENARSYANVYKRRGKIQRENCVICGMLATMHHPDYSIPLLVVWLCKACHKKHHEIESKDFLSKEEHLFAKQIREAIDKAKINLSTKNL